MYINRVVSQYLTSKFLDHTTAEDLNEKGLNEVIYIGKFSFHIAHRAFELGSDATKWHLKIFP